MRMPMMTVCQLIFARSLDVAQKTPTKTAKPNRLTARSARVLLADSLVAKVPTRMTARVRADRMASFVDWGMWFEVGVMFSAQRWAIGFVTSSVGKWSVSSLIESPSQTRKGTSHPKS